MGGGDVKKKKMMIIVGKLPGTQIHVNLHFVTCQKLKLSCNSYFSFYNGHAVLLFDFCVYVFSIF